MSSLSDQVRSAHRRLYAAQARLTPAHTLANGWSVAETLSALTAWQAEIVTALAKVRLGQTPRLPARTPAQAQARTAEWLAEYRQRPFDRVLADFTGVHTQLLRQLEAVTEADLNAPRRWLDGQSLRAWVTREAVDQVNAYAAQLEAL